MKKSVALCSQIAIGTIEGHPRRRFAAPFALALNSAFGVMQSSTNDDREA
jgi:hypothetical protein